MKRSPLKRKMPLRRMSDKKRREINETLTARRNYVAERWLCECCGTRRATECHEIPRGSHRHNGVKDRALQLALCPDCHRKIHESPHCTISWQVAVKFLSSPNECNPFTISQARGRAETAILWGDVAKHLNLKEPE